MSKFKNVTRNDLIGEHGDNLGAALWHMVTDDVVYQESYPSAKTPARVVLLDAQLERRIEKKIAAYYA